MALTKIERRVKRLLLVEPVLTMRELADSTGLSDPELREICARLGYCTRKPPHGDQAWHYVRNGKSFREAADLIGISLAQTETAVMRMSRWLDLKDIRVQRNLRSQGRTVSRLAAQTRVAPKTSGAPRSKPPPEEAAGTGGSPAGRSPSGADSAGPPSGKNPNPEAGDT